MNDIDVLLYDRIDHVEGAAFTRRTLAERGVGGSEIELVQVAHALAERGHKVALANGVPAPVEEDGVLYVPNTDVAGFAPTKALYLQRMSVPGSPLHLGASVRMIVRANDIYVPAYDVHRSLLESGRAALVANTKWQADGFTYAKDKIVIPPMLDESPAAIWPDRRGFATTDATSLPGDPGSTTVYKTPGLFVYASGPMKGLDATLAMWRKLHALFPNALRKTKLAIISPGWGDFPPPSPSDEAIGIHFEGVPTPAKYREWIAKAEGLFFVNSMAEAFCCSAALAERSGTRTHILCKNGLGGIPEAIVNHSLLTESESEFIDKFMDAWQSVDRREQWYSAQVPDRRPAALIDSWVDALRLTRGAVAVPALVRGGPYDMDSSHETIVPTGPMGIAPTSLRCDHGNGPLGCTMADCPHFVDPRPRRAGTHIGHYVNALLPENIQQGQWGSAQRYWIHDQVLVGGSIIDAADADRLRAFGVTHVLSGESERPDDGKWPDERRARFAWTDNSTSIDEALLHSLFDWVEQTFASEPNAVLYAHCQMGGSRGPTLGYIVLRLVFKCSPAEAMLAIRAPWAGDNRKPNPNWVPHLDYIESVERALETRPAKDGSRLLLAHGQSTPLITNRILDAYRDTSHFDAIAAKLLDKEALYEIFRKNVAALGAVDEATASEQWRKRCALISERAKRNMDEFLLWSEDLYITGLPRNERVAFEALHKSDWTERWEKLTRKSRYGSPRSSMFDDGATATTIQHAHHIKMFEQTTGHKNLGDCDVVVEIGGGFGGFCRTLRADGFRGTHIIIDLPHVREFARLFLALEGVPIADTPTLNGGACLLTPADIEAVLALVSGKRVAFVATWSLSETPIALRQRLFPALHKDCVAYLIATQWDHKWEGIDNRAYFETFMRDSGARWQVLAVPGDSDERYLFGLQAVAHAPGLGLIQKLEKTVRAKLGADLASFEKMLDDDRVVFRTHDLMEYPARVPPRADGRPTVGLLFICKGDEGATIIARAIVSIIKHVDAVTVVADGGPKTIEVCRALGADVYQRKTPEFNWETGNGKFALARNEALDIAERRTDYVLMCDPDDWYEGEIPKDLTMDLYEVFIYDSNLRYPRAQLLRSSKSFRYAGIIHEQIVAQNATIGRLDSLRYMRGHGGHQDQQPVEVKYAQHARWLERWLIDHPDDTRAQFYLGQSYRDARQYDKALVAYERRIEMGGWDEERGFAAAQIARILRDTGKDPTTAFLRSYEMRPTRAEPLYELAQWLRDDKQKRFALAAMVAKQAASMPLPTGDYLFIDPSVYEWRALQELGVALYWSGDKAGALSCYQQLIMRAPDYAKAHMQSALEMCIRELGGQVQNR